MDSNAICIDIIKKRCNSAYFMLLAKNPDWLEENGTSVLSEQLLFEMICLGKRDNRYVPILVQFVDYATPEAITDRVFDELLSFPEAMRGDIIVSLSHKSLCLQQLKVLCATGVTFECFYTLATYQFSNPAYDVSDLQETISKFRTSKFGKQLQILLEEVASYPTDNIEKLTFIHDLLDSL